MARRSESTDPRAQRLRASVKAAALALIREDTVDSSTLQDLLTKAGVSRQGFYEHFDSREDAILHALVDDFTEALSGLDIESASPRRLLQALAHSVDGRRDVYRHLRGAAIFEQVVDQWRSVMTPPLRRLTGSMPDPDATASFVVGGLLELFRDWLRSERPVSAARESDLLWRQIERVLAGSTTTTTRPTVIESARTR